MYEVHVLQNLEPTVHECHPISSSSCLCLSTLGFSGVLVNEFIFLLEISGGEEPKEMFIKLVSTIRKQRKTYLTLLTDLYVIFVIVVLCLLLSSMPQFSVIPVREIKYIKLGTAEGLVVHSFTVWLPLLQDAQNTDPLLSTFQ
jgi:hypothetical protein